MQAPKMKLPPRLAAQVAEWDATGLPDQVIELMDRWQDRRWLLSDSTRHWLDLTFTAGPGEWRDYWPTLAMGVAGWPFTCYWSSDHSDETCNEVGTVFAEARATHAGHIPSWWCSIPHAEDQNSWVRGKGVMALQTEDGTWDFSPMEGEFARARNYRR